MSRSRGLECNDLEMDVFWRFTADAIEATPEAPGVFAFFDEKGRLMLMGSAAKSLQAVLRSHWRGYEGGLTCGSTHFAWEKHDHPMTREAELAERYARRFGRLPRRRVG